MAVSKTLLTLAVAAVVLGAAFAAETAKVRPSAKEAAAAFLAKKAAMTPALRGNAERKLWSPCDQLDGGEQFLCSMALTVWSDIAPGNDLVSCIEGVGVTIDDFYNAGSTFETAWGQWDNGDHEDALGTCKQACQQLSSGLQEFEGVLSNCQELAALAERVGTIVARLDNLVGEAIEVLEVLLKADDIYNNAVDLVNNWGSWEQCGADAANIVCEASSLFGSSC